jgi:hypothetical protein
MTDDIEDEVQEAPVEAPEGEPRPAEDTESEVRRAIDTQRERGPDGKFVKSERATAAKGIATGAADSRSEVGRPDEGAHPDKDADAGKPARAAALVAPPPGFSVATKQAWDALPEHVKADVAKREGEIETGMKRYAGLANFAEEAERNGTTLQNAVSDYVSVEGELRKDPVSGVEFLFRKMGINPLAVLNQWVKRYVPQSQGDAQPNPNSEPNRQPQIDPNALLAQATSRATEAVRTEWQQRQIDSDIAAFKANPANRFFENVRMDMSTLVQAGKAADLQTAYEAACWLHPEIRAILLEEMKGGGTGAARTAARAQNAAKAVTGAPSSNSHASEPPRRRDLSTEDTVREAIKAQRGAA